MLKELKQLSDKDFLDTIDIKLEEMGYEPTHKIKIESIGDFYVLMSEWSGLSGATREAIGTLIISNGVEDTDRGKDWMECDPLEFVQFLKDWVYDEPVQSCGTERLAAEVYVALCRMEHFVQKHIIYEGSD